MLRQLNFPYGLKWLWLVNEGIAHFPRLNSRGRKLNIAKMLTSRKIRIDYRAYLAG